MKKRIFQIGVIGSAGKEEYPKKGSPANNVFSIAEKVGELIAQQNGILITGGKGGIMTFASRGAQRYNGITVGIVKGDMRNTANKYVNVEIVTNMLVGGGEMMLVLSCDGLIAIGGGAGTLQELTLAYRNKKPVVAIDAVDGYSKTCAGSYLDSRKLVKIQKATTPEEAVKKLYRELNSKIIKNKIIIK